MTRIWFSIALFGLATSASLAASGCKKADTSSDDDLQPAKVVREGGEVAANPHGGAGSARPASPHGAQPQTAPSEGGISGAVIETMNSGGYTYVRVQHNGEDVWAAGPETTLKVGDKVSFAKEMPMQDFRSNTLNRTFPLVYFVSSLGTGGGHSPTATGGTIDGGTSATPSAVAVGKVAKAEGGKSIAEIFAEKGALSGKKISVRGKVVKFNSGIMGRNWIHIQDGTGAAGSNDLTVTTDAMTEVGATVLITGVIATGKDFGAGYAYDVMIEEATISK